jgi:hypothetical protein
MSNLKDIMDSNRELLAVSSANKTLDLNVHINRTSTFLSKRFNYREFLRDLYFRFRIAAKFLDIVFKNDRAKFLGKRLTEWYDIYSNLYAENHPESSQKDKSKKPSESFILATN